MSREVMQQALEALYENTQYSMRGDPIAYQDQRNDDIIKTIKAALAQPEQEPVGFVVMERKPLTDAEIEDIVIEMNGNEPTGLFWRDLARAIEAAHGIGEKA